MSISKNLYQKKTVNFFHLFKNDNEEDGLVNDDCDNERDKINCPEEKRTDDHFIDEARIGKLFYSRCITFFTTMTNIFYTCHEVLYVYTDSTVRQTAVWMSGTVLDNRIENYLNESSTLKEVLLYSILGGSQLRIKVNNAEFYGKGYFHKLTTVDEVENAILQMVKITLKDHESLVQDIDKFVENNLNSYDYEVISTMTLARFLRFLGTMMPGNIYNMTGRMMIPVTPISLIYYLMLEEIIQFLKYYTLVLEDESGDPIDVYRVAMNRHANTLKHFSLTDIYAKIKQPVYSSKEEVKSILSDISQATKIPTVLVDLVSAYYFATLEFFNKNDRSIILARLIALTSSLAN